MHTNDQSILQAPWQRFRMVLKQNSVEPKFHDFYRIWVWNFTKSIKPKRLGEAETGSGILTGLRGSREFLTAKQSAIARLTYISN
jgi:hypothetical protein